jgi:chromosome segregation ATPase
MFNLLNDQRVRRLQQRVEMLTEHNKQLDNTNARLCNALVNRTEEVRKLHRACTKKGRKLLHLRNQLNTSELRGERKSYHMGYTAGRKAGLRQALAVVDAAADRLMGKNKEASLAAADSGQAEIEASMDAIGGVEPGSTTTGYPMPDGSIAVIPVADDNPTLTSNAEALASCRP